MGKRIVFFDADFSENGIVPKIEGKWAFNLSHEGFTTEGAVLNAVGYIVYDKDSCTNYELLQKHITKLRFDSYVASSFKLLKINKDNPYDYEEITEIECTNGKSQEVSVDIEIGSNYYLGLKNMNENCLHFYNGVGNYGSGFRMIIGESFNQSFVTSVISIDFYCEYEVG